MLPPQLSHADRRAERNHYSRYDVLCQKCRDRSRSILSIEAKEDPHHVHEFGPSTVCWLYKSLYAGDLCCAASQPSAAPALSRERFLKNWKAERAMSRAATPISAPEIGRVKKIVGSPLEIRSDCLKDLSMIGPSTNARISGPGSKAVLRMT